MWSFYIPLTGRKAAWFAAIVFTLVGAVIFFYLPTIIAPSARDAAVTIGGIHLLGGIFLSMGILALGWMLGDLYLKSTNPARRERWFWWGNFVLGVVGALLFAIPATLIFPIMLVAFLLKPNALFPVGVDPTNNLLVGLLFTGAGILSFGMLYFVARSKYRQRPIEDEKVK